MSVYIVILNQDSCEHFVGLFTTFEKAKEIVDLYPFDYGYLTINKIDTDKVYFTKVDDFSKTGINKTIGSNKFGIDVCNNKKSVDNFKSKIVLHEHNKLEDFIDENDYENDYEDDENGGSET